MGKSTMAVDERARHDLFLRVEEELGPEAAETLMEPLPPVGWADVATKEDLRQLEERMSLRLDLGVSELGASFEAKLHAQFRSLVVLNTSLVFAVAGIAFAAAKLS
jgi:hypothetical protein